MRPLLVILWIALTLASACGGDDDAPRVEDDQSFIRDRDGGNGTPGSDNVGTLGDAGARRDSGAGETTGKDGGPRDSGMDEPTDAGKREDAVQDSGGDPDCTPISARRDASCDGVDDDCDGKLDEDYVVESCDGRDPDLCKDGMLICTGMAGTLCTDDGQSHEDLCNGQDDDCDPTSADGSDEPSFGDACDGADGDLCAEGTVACNGVALHCSDDTGTTIELCNGVDDDCAPGTADGEDEPTLGQPCDGNDGDLCVEGAIACTASQLACSDVSPTTVELCNGEDDDCNPATADGSVDPQVGMPCDGPDSDLCPEGQYACSALGLVCNDATGPTVETCNPDADEDCDGRFDEHVDTDPACTTATAWGSVSGDNGEQTLTISGGGETWRTLTIREDLTTGSPLYLSAKISLTSAPNTDYDLYVYCERCGGAEAGFSDVGEGMTDVVDVRADDSAGNDTFTVVIEVAYFEATVCANWTLTVQSDNLVDEPTCN